ncbi:MAG: hypothetical protein NC218_08015, partial [Acetobacter sp.]|nr:hypothetical protein [Acetobacter sp.]
TLLPCHPSAVKQPSRDLPLHTAAKTVAHTAATEFLPFRSIRSRNKFTHLYSSGKMRKSAMLNAKVPSQTVAYIEVLGG